MFAVLSSQGSQGSQNSVFKFFMVQFWDSCSVSSQFPLLTSTYCIDICLLIQHFRPQYRVCIKINLHTCPPVEQMNKLPVILSLRLYKDFWDCQVANIANCWKKKCGERLFRRPKSPILEWGQRFSPQFYHKWIKIMLIRGKNKFY